MGALMAVGGGTVISVGGALLLSCTFGIGMGTTGATDANEDFDTRFWTSLTS